MDRKTGMALKRLLVLRRAKLEAEAGRLQNGIAAGSDLRERLMSTGNPQAYADLTMPHVLRTVGIIDRGIAVLRQQHEDLMVRRSQIDHAVDTVADRVSETAAQVERKDMESLIAETLAAIVPKASR